MNVYDATELAYKRGYKQGVKDVFEELEERLCVHSFTSKSEEYADGMCDCIDWVDGKIDELMKEMGCDE